MHLNAARIEIGAALMELRMLDGRRERVVHRVEVAYAKLLDLLEAAPLEDLEGFGDPA